MGAIQFGMRGRYTHADGGFNGEVFDCYGLGTDHFPKPLRFDQPGRSVAARGHDQELLSPKTPDNVVGANGYPQPLATSQRTSSPAR